MSTLKRNLVKYRLIEKHREVVKAGRYEEGRYLLRLLRTHIMTVGLGDDAGYAAECIAEKCGCRTRYARNYAVAHVSW